MKAKVSISTLVMLFVSVLYLSLTGQVNAAPTLSPGASASKFSSSASMWPGIKDLQSHKEHGEHFSGSADLYANVEQVTKKNEGAHISVTVGVDKVKTLVEVEVEIDIKGVKVKAKVLREEEGHRAYIIGRQGASVSKIGWPWNSKWALAKGTLGSLSKRAWANFNAPDTASSSDD